MTPMANISTLEMCRRDLFTAEEELMKTYTEAQVERILRIREMYNWLLANPEAKDRMFVEEELSRGLIRHRTQAYGDLAVVRKLAPLLAQSSREFHRWRFNELILETYQMAKKRKDTKTMEKAASSYAKYNRIDLEEEVQFPFELIAVQPFMATDDPRVLGIVPIPNVRQYVKDTLARYVKENADIEDITWEEADLEEDVLFPEDEEAPLDEGDAFTD